MAEHVWSVLCDFSIVDTASNKISLVNSLEQITLQSTEEVLWQEIEKAQREEKVPVLPISFQKVSYWVRSDPEESESVVSRVLLSFPDGEYKLGPPEEIALTTHFGFRFRSTMQGLPFGGLGVYWFNVCVGTGEPDSESVGDWQVVARLPLRILRAKEE